jgi:Outer membrane protein beta-barrel domain
MYRRLVVGIGLVALAAGPLAAQDFEIGPRLGYVKWKSETSMKGAGMLGVDAIYRLSSRLGVGVRLDVARPGTDPQYFSAEMSFGDTTLIFAVKQPLTVMQYEVQAQVETGGSFSLFAKGGAGGRTISLDPQSAHGLVTLTDWAFSVGGGIRLRTGGGTSVLLEAQDLIYPNFARDDLNPVEPRFRPTRFPDVVPAFPQFDGTAHNIYAAISFIFTPGGGR